MMHIQKYLFELKNNGIAVIESFTLRKFEKPEIIFPKINKMYKIKKNKSQILVELVFLHLLYKMENH